MPQVIDEKRYSYSFSRPALGETFRANGGFKIRPELTDQLSSGELVVDLDTGWESGVRWFVVPAGATRLELVDRGTPTRCDLVRFI